MLTRMSEDEWTALPRLFRSCHSPRGDEGRNDRMEALHDFTLHNISWRALPAGFGNWNSTW